MLIQSLLLFDDLSDLCIMVLEVGRGLPVVQIDQHVSQVAGQTVLSFGNLLLRWLGVCWLRTLGLLPWLRSRLS